MNTIRQKELELKREKERKQMEAWAESAKKEKESSLRRAELRQMAKQPTELDRYRQLITKEGGEPFVPFADVAWNTFQKLIGQVLECVNSSVIAPLSQELVREFGNNYNEAVAWFREFQQIDPFFIRYGSTLLYWDKDLLPPIIKQIAAFIDLGKVAPLHPEVKALIQSSPDKINQLFEGPFSSRIFLVWIGNEVYLFDRERWTPAVDSDYLIKWSNFNTHKAWGS